MAGSFFSPRQLNLESLKNEFRSTGPFKHVIIDNFFEHADALALHKAFPAFSKAEETKARIFSGRVFGPPPSLPGSPVGHALTALSNRAFAEIMSQISGIKPLAMDETNEGAGVHIGLSGSTLPIHVDHNTHPRAPWLYRRLNIIIYLNPNWDSSWRANLLLYDRRGTRRILEIEPRFNRAVIMEVHDFAFHGYRSLILPSGQSRHSLAAYFYSTEPAVEQAVQPHGTVLANPHDFSIYERSVLIAKSYIRRYFGSVFPVPKWPDVGNGDRTSQDRSIRDGLIHAE